MRARRARDIDAVVGGNEQRGKSNVLIPDTGAAKFWYVDPNAGRGATDKHAELLDALSRLIGTPQYQDYQPNADQGGYQF